MQSPKLVPISDRGPGRPREFELDAAVDDAIEVFRAHGYHGTSVQDLSEGTGLARGSLYKAFHDKRTLFLAALDHYTAASLRRVGERFGAARPGARGDSRRADRITPGAPPSAGAAGLPDHRGGDGDDARATPRSAR